MRTDVIYEKFAHRFLETGDRRQAALDVGVPADTLNEFLKISTTHPDVIAVLAADEMSVPDFMDATSVREHLFRKLWREANYKGTGAQQGARIAALKAIADLAGVEPAKKIDINSGMQGGVLLTPVTDMGLWEESAARMQRELKETARD